MQNTICLVMKRMIFFLTITVLLASCLPDYFDFNKISDEIEISPGIAAPIVYGSLTMSAAYTVGDFIYGKNGIDYHKKELKNTTGFNAVFLKKRLRVNGDFTFRNYDIADAASQARAEAMRQVIFSSRRRHTR